MHVDYLSAREPSAGEASFESMTISVSASLIFILVGTSISTAPARKVAEAQPDGGGRTQAPSASAIENAPESLRGPLVAIHESLSSVPLGSWHVMVDGAGRKERLGWLGRDFRTSAFTRAERVDEGLLQTQTPEGPLHLGLLVIHFRKCKDLVEARIAVAKAGRMNFRLPVLTLFRTKARGHDMIIVLSETPIHRQVDALLKNIDGVLRNDLACSD
jgi:hypothetical protein